MAHIWLTIGNWVCNHSDCFKLKNYRFKRKYCWNKKCNQVSLKFISVWCHDWVMLGCSRCTPQQARLCSFLTTTTALRSTRAPPEQGTRDFFLFSKEWTNYFKTTGVDGEMSLPLDDLHFWSHISSRQTHLRQWDPGVAAAIYTSSGSARAPSLAAEIRGQGVELGA